MTLLSKTVFSKIASAVLDLLFPKQCLGCGKEKTFLCDRCFLHIHLSQETLHLEHLDQALDEVFVCCESSALLRDTLHQLKYHYCEEIAEILGRFYLKRFLLEELEDFTIVPVPLHVRRLKERAFNQSELLGRALPIPFLNLLQRKKYTRPQVELSREERLKNVFGVFAIADFFKNSSGDSSEKGVLIPSRVLLIDDVCTTGATLLECAKVLREAGVQHISAMVLARGL